MNDIKETLGRLYLWKTAIDRVFELLKFRKKIERFHKTGRPQYIRTLYDEERSRLNNWLELEGEELNNFEKKNGSLFPDALDIGLIDELITEEIIIKLCTVFNEGNGKLGIVADNTPKFKKPILNKIYSKAFTVEVQSKFKKFICYAISYRNKQGAHFDNIRFEVEHGDKKLNENGIIYRLGYSSALLEFDWDFVAYTIPYFRNSLNDYIKELQKEAGLL